MQACIHDGCIYRVGATGKGKDGISDGGGRGCASPLEGNKGGATREIKGAPKAGGGRPGYDMFF